MFPFNRVAKRLSSRTKFIDSGYNIKVLVVAENGEQFTTWATENIGGTVKVSLARHVADVGRIQYLGFIMDEVFNTDKWRGHVFNHVLFLGKSKLSHENACIIQSCIRD